jgi:hypothetical protein
MNDRYAEGAGIDHTLRRAAVVSGHPLGPDYLLAHMGRLTIRQRRAQEGALAYSEPSWARPALACAVLHRRAMRSGEGRGATVHGQRAGARLGAEQPVSRGQTGACGGGLRAMGREHLDHHPFLSSVAYHSGAGRESGQSLLPTGMEKGSISVLTPYAQEEALSNIDTFEAMLARGQDSALLRYSLGNEYAKQENPERAVTHLAEAVRQDPGYSAAWKLYGKVLSATGRYQASIDAFDRGIATAEKHGDVQAAKEMRVFRKRAEKGLSS